MVLTLDNIIVCGFLLLTLIVGLLSGRNIKTMRDYAIAGKNYPTAVLVVTLLATAVGGGTTTGIAAEVFQVGILFSLVAAGSLLSSLVVAYWIAPKFAKVPESCLSISDVIEHYYGRNAAIFSAAIGVIYSIGIVALQFIALGHVFHTYFDLPFFYGVIISGAAVTAYSTIGGVRAVTMTDVLQFAVLIVVVPLIANVTTNHAGGIWVVFDQLDPEYLRVTSHPKFNVYLAFAIIYFLPSSWFLPSIVQRMLMARNVKQIQTMFVFDAFIRLCLISMVTVMTFAAILLFPDVEPKAIIPTIINEILPTGIKGIAVAGMFALIMSTVDSSLNAASTLFTHNLITPIFRTSSNDLLIARISTVVIGAAAILIASYDFNIMALNVTMTFIWSCTIAVSFWFALLFIKPPKVCFYLCAATAASCFFILQFVPSGLASTQIQLLALTTGLLTYLIAYYILKRKHLRLPRSFNWKPPSLTPAIPPAVYTVFAIFSLLNYVVPFYMWPAGPQEHYGFALTLRVISSALCVGVLLKGYLFRSAPNWFGLYWHFTLLVCLPFTVSYMYLMHDGSNEWLINGCLAIFLLASLTHWQHFAVLMLLGTISGISVAYLNLGHLTITPTFEKVYLGMYSFLLTTAIAVTFNQRYELFFKESITPSLKS